MKLMREVRIAKVLKVLKVKHIFRNQSLSIDRTRTENKFESRRVEKNGRIREKSYNTGNIELRNRSNFSQIET